MAASSGFEFWKTVLNSARFVVAPMVDQSELAWRMLSRQLGAQLCYTPMLHASVFCKDARYRRDTFTTCPEDRPLIVQFCANDPDIFIKSSKLVEDYCDAIDLNLGCPQTIARRGHYGAFLQDEWDLIFSIVKRATECISVPITCKIRVFEDVDKTVQYAKMLESAGCKLLTIHGRTREQKGPNTGLASWKHIAAVCQAVSIPVFANGNIQYLKDVFSCMEETGANAVMTAEGSLRNPAIFTGQHPSCWEMSEAYLSMVDKYPAPLSAVRGHLFKIWHHVLQRPENHERRKQIGCARSLEQLKTASQLLSKEVQELLTEDELQRDFSLDAIPYWRCQPYVRPSPRGVGTPHKRRPSSDPEKDGQVVLTNKLLKKKKRLENYIPKALRREICTTCKTNPKGLKCVNGLCKKCCRPLSKQKGTDCEGHRLVFSYKKDSEREGNDRVLPSPLVLPSEDPDIEKITVNQ